MSLMLTLSLSLNVAVLLPVCAGLLTGANWARACYGDDSPARRILLSVYLSIATVSVALLFVRWPVPAASLLFIQVVYKLTTPFTVGRVTKPVVVSNLGIAAFHAVTLTAIWQAGVSGGWSPAE